MIGGMRPTLFALVCISAVGYFVGCGSSGDSSGDGNGGKKEGGTGASGSGATGNGGAAGGGAASGGAGGAAASGTGGAAASGASDSGLTDVSFSYDADPEDSGFDPDATCASSTVNAEPLPLDLYVILDASGSMGTDCNVGGGATSKWCYAVNALYDFFAAPSSAGTGAALSFFSGTACPNLGTPQVPYSVLPANLAAFQNALNAAGPNGNTPTSAAANGIATYTAANEKPGRKMIGVLITDGDPTSCAPTAPAQINTILANHFANTGIPTFIIGMTGATFGNLETLANNAGAPSHTQYCGGGVSPCHFYNVANGDPLVFAAVLAAIQQVAIGCQYKLPSAEAGLVDPDKVNVQYTPGGGSPQTLPRKNDASQCGTTDGWYYDNNASPTLIVLCPATCTKVTADKNAKIDIELACQGS
jgi:von Willebrand factor type A domain